MQVEEYEELKNKIKTFEETTKKHHQLTIYRALLVDENYKEFNLYTPHNSTFKLSLSMNMRKAIANVIDEDIESLEKIIKEL